jgi:hypothetical protein
MRALAAVAAAVPRAHLLVAGEAVDYYDMRSEAEELGVTERVTLAGYLPDEDIDDYLEAADVCICMRWPTSRETSASWLRCMAAGKPTIATDLVHTVDVPTLDPRSWSLLAGLKAGTTHTSAAAGTPDAGAAAGTPDAGATAGTPDAGAAAGTTRTSATAGTMNPSVAGTPDAGVAAGTTNASVAGMTDADARPASGGEPRPVGVSIDVLDEDHSLKLAIRRLAADDGLRAALGAAAWALWADRFSLARMVDGYRRAIGLALDAPAAARTVDAALPQHLRSTGAEHAESLLKEILGSEYHLRDAD